jgi:co-chaperonin GroES (HSP10)
VNFLHRATNDRIILDATKQNMSDGGIFIAKWDNKESDRGTVLAIGPDVKDKRIEVGMELIFGRYAATHFDGESLDCPKGTELVVIREEDVMLLLQPKSALKAVVNH